MSGEKFNNIQRGSNGEGITPAWAGKSYVFGPFRPGSWDHPRVGGEKASEYTRPLISLGSPPRRRGKCVQADSAGAWAGITPA